jgi:hypothetical protein
MVLIPKLSQLFISKNWIFPIGLAFCLIFFFSALNCSPKTASFSAKSIGSLGRRSWIQELHDKPCERLGFSQGNQDCMLDIMFKELGTTNKKYVEFGFNTPKQCSGSGPNTCKLWKDGWTGLLLDGVHQSEEINLRAHFLFASNIVGIFNRYFVPKELDYLSVDMDSHDFFVLESILKQFQPRVISTEYNCNWPIGWHMSELDPELSSNGNSLRNSWQFKGCMWGSSASGWKLLLEANGYSLVGVAQYLDLFWARNDLLVNVNVPEFDYFVDRILPGTLSHPMQTTNIYRELLVDTKVWLETKNISLARDIATKRIETMISSDRRIQCFKQLSPVIKL